MWNSVCVCVLNIDLLSENVQYEILRKGEYTTTINLSCHMKQWRGLIEWYIPGNYKLHRSIGTASSRICWQRCVKVPWLSHWWEWPDSGARSAHVSFDAFEPDSGICAGTSCWLAAIQSFHSNVMEILLISIYLMM